MQHINGPSTAGSREAHLKASHCHPASLQAKICVAAAQQTAHQKPGCDRPECQLGLCIAFPLVSAPVHRSSTYNHSDVRTQKYGIPKLHSD